MSFVLRKTLSSFRCSAHDLMIEKGRHLSIDRHLRFCPLCVKNNISVVEDEYHFFFECNEYETFRQTFFKPDWLRNRSHQIIYAILCLKDEHNIIRIAKFLHKSLVRRKEILNIHT